MATFKNNLKQIQLGGDNINNDIASYPNNLASILGSPYRLWVNNNENDPGIFTIGNKGNIVRIGGSGKSDSLWQVKELNGQKYLFTDLPIVSERGITMYTGTPLLPSVFEGLPLDNVTLGWRNGLVSFIGEAGGGEGTVTGVKLGSTLYDPVDGIISLPAYPDVPSWALQATKPSYSFSEIQNKPTTLEGYGITDALSSSSLADYVTKGTSQQITGEKDFTGGLKVNGSPITYNAEKNYWMLNGDLLITGSMSMYANEGTYTPSTILDGLSVDANTLSKANGILSVIGGGGTPISVYGYSSLDTTFSDADRNNTFNAYTIATKFKEFDSFKAGLGGNYVTVDTAQTITGWKVFSNTSLQLSSHLYRGLYDAIGNVYDHYYPADFSKNVNTSANLRVWDALGSATKSLRFAGDGSFTWDGRNVLHSGNYNSYAPTLTGAGASGTWAIDIAGKANRILVGGVSNDATYGDFGGIIQDDETGPIYGSWYNKIKILHNNAAGYFTELAQCFSGTEALWHRRMIGGSLSAWRLVLDHENFSGYALPLTGGSLTGNLTISGNQVWHAGNSNLSAVDWTAKNIFAAGSISSGYTTLRTPTNNDYNGAAVEIAGIPNTYAPRIGFHQPGLFAGSLAMLDGNNFAFYQQGGSSLANVRGNALFADNWIYTYGNCGWYNQTYGGGIHMQDSIWVRIYNGKAFYVSNTNDASSLVSAGGSDDAAISTAGGLHTAKSIVSDTNILAKDTLKALSTTSAANNMAAIYTPGGIFAEGNIQAVAGFSVHNTSPTSRHGVSLYGQGYATDPTYGILFTGTSGFGTHGGVTSDWATYFTMSDTTNRGWIFRRGVTNVASISGNGDMLLEGSVSFNSDMRLKDIVKNRMLTINQIANAPLFDYTYKYDATRQLRSGTSAQYWKDILPTVVSGSKYLAMDYSSLGVVLGISLANHFKTFLTDYEKKEDARDKEIRELKKEIAELKMRIAL